jgi:hypothetical protein
VSIESIKCRECGSSDVAEFKPGIYVCGHCEAVSRQVEPAGAVESCYCGHDSTATCQGSCGRRVCDQHGIAQGCIDGLAPQRDLEFPDFRLLRHVAFRGYATSPGVRCPECRTADAITALSKAPILTPTPNPLADALWQYCTYGACCSIQDDWTTYYGALARSRGLAPAKVVDGIDVWSVTRSDGVIAEFDDQGRAPWVKSTPHRFGRYSYETAWSEPPPRVTWSFETWGPNRFGRMDVEKALPMLWSLFNGDEITQAETLATTFGMRLALISAEGYITGGEWVGAAPERQYEMLVAEAMRRGRQSLSRLSENYI